MMNSGNIAITLLLASLLGMGISSCNQNPTAVKQPKSEITTTNTSSSAPDRVQRRLAMQNKIKAILTPAQVQQLDAKIKDGDKMRTAMKTIDLTTDQQAKIKEIYQSARAERKQSSEENGQ